MIKLSEHLNLQDITLGSHSKLYNLMCTIYPPEYNHFWLDDSSWYINSQYAIENLQKELSEENQQYYFVVFKDEVVGILRLLFNVEMNAFSKRKSVKLHRIYLDRNIQGKGIGKTIVTFVEELVQHKGYELLWLEAMEKKPLALKFYESLGFQKGDEYLYEFDLLKKDYQKMVAVYKEY